MHQRPALQAGEHRRVDLLRHVLVVGEDQPAARTAQRLVRGRRDYMRMRDRRRMRAARDEPGEMRHVDHQIGADRIRDLAKAPEIPDARIGGAAGEDELRLVGVRDPLDLVIVEQLVLAPHAIGHDLEPFPAHVDRRAVRQVPARREVEAHEGVARLKQRQKHRLVHLAAGVRLHVGEVRAEELFRALDRQRLRDVHELAAAVIAFSRIALGVFVGHHRALRLQHSAGHDVFGGDQLDLMPAGGQARWRSRRRSPDPIRRASPRRRNLPRKVYGLAGAETFGASADEGSTQRLLRCSSRRAPRDTTAVVPRQAKRQRRSQRLESSAL